MAKEAVKVELFETGVLIGLAGLAPRELKLIPINIYKISLSVIF